MEIYLILTSLPCNVTYMEKAWTEINCCPESGIKYSGASCVVGVSSIARIINIVSVYHDRSIVLRLIKSNPHLL